MPKVAFTTLGCKVNQYETEVMTGLFQKRGYTVVDFTQKADVYVLNTCSVTHLGERKSRQLIRRASRLNPHAVIAVTGCYAQIAPEQLKELSGVSVLVGTKERGRIVDLVEQAAASGTVIDVVTNIMQADTFEEIPLFNMPGRTRAFLKIQEGCTNFCTYCIIPYTRGPLRSRRLESVQAQARELVAAGFKEIVLTGIHLGAYGRDLPEDITLADAVNAVLEIKELQRLRLGSLESVELSAELFAALERDKRFCPHLHLPLQAGHDAVLKAMNRHYDRAKFARLIEQVKNKVPDVAISTDIIVGFPGETEEQFADGLRFAEGLGFSRIHVFPYSRRQGTPAFSFSQQVSEEIKKERAHRMQKMAQQQARLFQEKFIGRTLPVLFETKSEGIYDGLTGNYIRVYVKSPDDLHEQIRDVVLKEPYRDGLWGEVVR